MGGILDVSEKEEEEGPSQLHLAAERGDTKAVRSLLMSLANVDVLDTKHNTPLHYATLNGHVEVIYLLLRNNASVNSKNAFGQTSLHLASKKGHVATAQLLLNSNADVNAVCRRQATPLHLAAKRGHAEIVKNLIFNSAIVNACDNDKMTPLHLACQNGHTSIVEILLDNHAIVDVTKQPDETPFYLAAKNGHAAVSDLLLRHGVCDFVLKDDKQTPLHDAVEEGHTKVVEVILKHSCRISGNLIECGQKLKENAKNSIETSGIQPIQLLRSDGRRISAGIVWTEKSKPLELWEDKYDRIALFIAVKSVQPKMVQLLLNADQCTYSDDHLRSSIYYFRSSINAFFRYDATDCRHNKETGKVRSYDEQYQTYCDDRKEIAQALINVIHQDVIEGTSLHRAMTYGFGKPEETILKNQLMQMLLEKGADFNMKDSNGNTPLMNASENGDCDSVQILFDWEQKSGIKLELDVRDHNGETALIKAADENHVSVMRMLLSHRASVNLQDHYGFTALHAVVYEPNTIWFDFYFFCKGLLKRNFDDVNSLEMSGRDKSAWRKETTVHPRTVIGRVQNYLRHGRITTQRKEELLDFKLGNEIVDTQTVIDRLQSNLEDNERTIRLREQMVNLLLDNDETNVNAIDVRGNTPLDLAVKSSKRINSAILKALKNRGAIRSLLEPEDEAPIEVARVDERGRNPLHRLFIFRISGSLFGDSKVSNSIQDEEQYDFMVNGILLSPENFRELATATDYKGRIPLHYAVMSTSCHHSNQYPNLMRVLLEIGPEVNAVDIYGKTPLHYAETNDQYERLVQYGADENTKDYLGNTPRKFKQLRESVTIKEQNAWKLTVENSIKDLYLSNDIAQVLNAHYVTELTKQKLFETIRIYSQSPRPQESAEEAIWKMWTQQEFIRLNRHLSQLNPLIHQFIDRLAEGIKEKDWRFECQPILVGSADEETKAVISADFDFNFKLTEFSQCCDPFPHPLGPKGYFQLRRKPNYDTKSRRDENFDSFFNLDQCLLTNEVNSRFKIILEEVLSDPAFWEGEQLFDWNMTQKYSSRYGNLDGLCKTVKLQMLNPIDDGEGSFLFLDTSIDIVACVQVDGWWPEDSLPVGMSPSVKTNGCAFVFQRRSFDHFVFSETLARISFAPLESRILKESSPLIKAAYIICKIILSEYSKATNQLKTCVFFCMEALNARNGSETEKEENITPKQLAFWVERIMFCYMEFSRHGIYPCYFMPSFRRRVLHERGPFHRFLKIKDDKCDYSSKDLEDFGYYAAFGLYLDLCPDGSTCDIPIEARYDEIRISERKWETFDREEFIRTLSSRSSH